jgi:glycosyltransferase involved in cell wall biosynthesis
MPADSLHILYVVQYFNRPDEPGGSRPYQFASSWAARGHRVTVLAGNMNHKTLSKADRAGDRAIEGVRVIRVPTYNAIRGSYRKRFLNFLSYALMAAVRGLAVPRVDVVYASSTPLTTGLAGWILAKLKRAPFYFEVRDLWPESALVAGALKRGALVRAAEFFERLFYRSARKVIALTQGIRDGVIARGKAPGDVLFVPNGMDDWMLETTPTLRPDLPFDRRQHFICAYVGAHGRWNRLETILQAAERTRGTNIRFLFVGDGDFKPDLERMAKELRLDNVCFLDAVPKKQVLDYLASAHVAVICTWDHPFQRMVLANKVFDYMAAARPIVAAARGETAAVVQDAGCGWVVEPEQPDDLARLLVRTSALSEEELRRIGAAGRAYVAKHYLRSDLADRLQRTFAEVA